MDSTINRIKLGEDVSDKIQIVGVGDEEMDSVTATVDDIKVSKPKPKADSVQEEQSSYFGDTEQEKPAKQEGEQMTFVLMTFLRPSKQRSLINVELVNIGKNGRGILQKLPKLMSPASPLL